MVTKLAKTIMCVIQFVACFACLSKKKTFIKWQHLRTVCQLFNHIDLQEVKCT